MSFTSKRDVYLIVSARGLGFLGDFLAATSLILALQGRGAGGYAVAALLIAAALPAVVLAPVAARVVDRVDSRVVLVVVGLAQALTCVAMSFVEAPWTLVGLAALLSVGLAFSGPTFNALLPEAAGLDGVGRATAVMQTGLSVGALVGPSLAGVLVGFSGVRVPLLLDAACYLLVAAGGLAIGTRRGVRSTSDAPAQIRWRLRGDSLLCTLMVMVALLLLAVNATQVVIVFFIRETLHGSATMYGFTEGAWTAGMLAGGWIASSRPGSERSLSRRLVLLHIATGLVIAVAGRLTSVWWLFPLWALGGSANGMINNAMAVLVARRIPAVARGRFYAVFGGVANGANLIGFGLGGVLLAHVPPATIITGGGLLGLVLVVIVGGRVWQLARTADGPAASSSGPAPSANPGPTTAGSSAPGSAGSAVGSVAVGSGGSDEAVPVGWAAPA